MTYEKDIFKVLQEAGDGGLSVRKIARHVFNANNSFFQSADKDEISQAVQRYLAYHSRSSNDTIEKVGYGRYRLNLKSRKTKLKLQEYFTEKDEEKKPGPAQELILDLF